MSSPSVASTANTTSTTAEVTTTAAEAGESSSFVLPAGSWRFVWTAWPATGESLVLINVAPGSFSDPRTCGGQPYDDVDTLVERLGFATWLDEPEPARPIPAIPVRCLHSTADGVLIELQHGDDTVLITLEGTSAASPPPGPAPDGQRLCGIATTLPQTATEAVDTFVHELHHGRAAIGRLHIGAGADPAPQPAS